MRKDKGTGQDKDGLISEGKRTKPQTNKQTSDAKALTTSHQRPVSLQATATLEKVHRHPQVLLLSIVS